MYIALIVFFKWQLWLNYIEQEKLRNRVTLDELLQEDQQNQTVYSSRSFKYIVTNKQPNHSLILAECEIQSLLQFQKSLSKDHGTSTNVVTVSIRSLTIARTAIAIHLTLKSLTNTGMDPSKLADKQKLFR